MAFEDFSIMQFRRAWFKGDRTVMNDETFSTVYNEYIDVSGQYRNEEFDRVSTLHYMNNRRNAVVMAIKLQREFVKEFTVPFVDNFPWFKEKGFKLTWKDEEDFEKQLQKIEAKEEKWESIIQGKVKELKEYRDKKEKKEVSTKQSESSFVRMVNQLRKNGWKFEWTDSVEDLAYIVKQQLEDQK